MKADSRPVGFLLGAGASVTLGYPTLWHLTTEVGKRIQSRHAELGRVYQELTKTGGSRGTSPSISIERALAIIDSALQQGLVPPKTSTADLAFLGHEIRKEIWMVLQEDRGLDDELAYLDPMVNFIESEGPVVVFSLNNDRVIERWCRRKSVKLLDGFDRNGILDSTLLKPKQGCLTLIKLHGSVDWERDSRGAVRKSSGLVHSPSGRRAFRSPLPELTLVFPSEVKLVTEQPFFDLLRCFHDILRRLSSLTVVGCGLHDPHISSAIQHHLYRSGALRVLIVDPYPLAPLEALAPTRRHRQQIGNRIDVLQLKFEGALNGPIQACLKRDASSLPNQIRNVLFDAPPRTEAASKHFKDLLRDYAVNGGTNLLSLVPAMTNAERLPSPWEQVFNLLEVDPSAKNWDSRLLEALERSEASAIPRSLASFGDRLFALANDRLWLCDSTGIPLQPIGPSVPGASDFVIVGNYAFVVQTRLLNCEGLGCLRRINLGTGSSKHLARNGRSLALALIRSSSRLTSFQSFRNRAEFLQTLRRRLYEAGVLKWPSSIKCLPDQRLLLIESRQPILLDLETHEVERPLPAKFINLADAVSISPTQVVLLEGGVEGRGRLWIWKDFSEDTSPWIEDVQRGSSLAWDPSLGLVLWTQGGDHGKVMAVAVNPRGEPGEPFAIAGGLYRPRRIHAWTRGNWLCCTGHGVVRFNPGAALK